MPPLNHRRRTATAALVAGTLIGTGLVAASATPAFADVPIGDVQVSDLPWLNESN